ncbi:hypothetical protein GCM10022226_46860 [Sphaerisporangium flaviroseum]|uniref:Integrase catalytic domain-containing protein n=1 Tax=Sphaerisporangium flaviroseum TaxID=509199 RepID=A0ABP7ILH9_9ACTN
MHEDNYGVYGIRKVHAALARDGGVAGRPVARCTVARLMKAAGLKGVSRAAVPRTTRPSKAAETRQDLVKRAFTATAPNRLWVADITYIRTFTGWVYAAFVLDVFSRRVVGWQVATHLRTDLALDALEMGLWTRRRAGQNTTDLIHHSDRGVQYVAVRYTQRLAEAGAGVRVGQQPVHQVHRRVHGRDRACAHYHRMPRSLAPICVASGRSASCASCSTAVSRSLRLRHRAAGEPVLPPAAWIGCRARALASGRPTSPVMCG